MTQKGEIIHDQDGSSPSFMSDCPACGIGHSLRIRDDKGQRPSWSWNGSMSSPTFTPSLSVKWSKCDNVQIHCHSYITDGQIQFLSDCTHALAGQTVDMPEYVP